LSRGAVLRLGARRPLRMTGEWRAFEWSWTRHLPGRFATRARQHGRRSAHEPTCKLGRPAYSETAPARPLQLECDRARRRGRPRPGRRRPGMNEQTTHRLGLAVSALLIGLGLIGLLGSLFVG